MIRLSALAGEDDDDVLSRNASTAQADKDKWNIFEPNRASSKQDALSAGSQPKRADFTARIEKPEAVSSDSATTTKRNRDDLSELSQLIDSFEGPPASSAKSKPKRPTSPPKTIKKFFTLEETRDRQSSLDALSVSSAPIAADLEFPAADSESSVAMNSETASLSECPLSASSSDTSAVPSRGSTTVSAVYSQSGYPHAQSFTNTPSGGSPTHSTAQMQPSVRVNSALSSLSHISTSEFTLSKPSKSVAHHSENGGGSTPNSSAEAAEVQDIEAALRPADAKPRSSSDEHRKAHEEPTKLRSRTSLDEIAATSSAASQQNDTASASAAHTSVARLSSASLNEITKLAKAHSEPQSQTNGGVQGSSATIVTASARSDVELAIASVNVCARQSQAKMTPSPIASSTKLDQRDAKDKLHKVFQTMETQTESASTSTKATDSDDQPSSAARRSHWQHDETLKRVRSLPWFEFGCVALAVFAYHVLPLPREIYFFFAGAFGVATMWLLHSLLRPRPHPLVQDRVASSASPYGDQFKPLFAIEPEIRSGCGFEYFNPVMSSSNQLSFRTWMNELDTHAGAAYTPADYHITQTVSALVTLENSTLTIGRPRANVPRRAAANENPEKYLNDARYKIGSTRTYALQNGAVVCLLPFELVRKRFWSKKYPICVVVPRRMSQSPSSNASRSPRSSAERSLPHSASHPTLALSGNSSANTSLFAHFSSLIDAVPTDATTRARVPDFDYVSSRLKQLTLDQCDVLYFFTRTCVEKELWYKRLRDACLNVPRSRLLSHMFGTNAGNGGSSSSSEHEQQQQQQPPSPSEVADDFERITVQMPTESSVMRFGEYMARYLPAEWIQQLATRTGQLPQSGSNPQITQKMMSSAIAQATHALLNAHFVTCDKDLVWFNALLGRLFYDFLNLDDWREKVQRKIQKKLSTIKIPHFIDTFRVTEVQVGSEMPIVRKALGGAYLDENGGLWFDLEVAYRGSFYMQIETKVNLMRLKRDKLPGTEKVSFRASAKQAHALSANDDPSGEVNTEMREISTLCTCSHEFASVSSGSKRDVDQQHTANCRLARARKLNLPKRAIIESDEEDSGESSTDSESEQKSSVASTPDSEKHLDLSIAAAMPPAANNKEASGSSTSRRFLSVIDRISSSSYFQKATEFGVIKRAMESVSNTPVLLNVSLESLEGCLAVHIGAPPTDRIWYGFRTPPKMRLQIKPKLGERQVTMSHIIDFIERKLTQEFQRVLVMPNMDDVVVPFMSDVYRL